MNAGRAAGVEGSRAAHRIWARTAKNAPEVARELLGITAGEFGDILLHLDGGEVWQFSPHSSLAALPAATSINYIRIQPGRVRIRKDDPAIPPPPSYVRHPGRLVRPPPRDPLYEAEQRDPYTYISGAIRIFTKEEAKIRGLTLRQVRRRGRRGRPREDQRRPETKAIEKRVLAAVDAARCVLPRRCIETAATDLHMDAREVRKIVDRHRKSDALRTRQ